MNNSNDKESSDNVLPSGSAGLPSDFPRLTDLLAETETSAAMLARLFAKHHAVIATGTEITPAQGLLLRLLQERGELRMSELAVLLGVKPPAASALVDHAERLGLLERVADASDRRVTRVRITPEGAESVRSLEIRQREYLRRFVSALSEEDLETLVRIHHKLIDAMAADAS